MKIEDQIIVSLKKYLLNDKHIEKRKNKSTEMMLTFLLLRENNNFWGQSLK